MTQLLTADTFHRIDIHNSSTQETVGLRLVFQKKGERKLSPEQVIDTTDHRTLDVQGNEFKWIKKLQEQNDYPVDPRPWIVTIDDKGRGHIHAITQQQLSHIGTFRFAGSLPDGMDIVKGLVKTGYRKRPAWLVVPYSLPWLERILPCVCGIQLGYWKDRN